MKGGDKFAHGIGWGLATQAIVAVTNLFITPRLVHTFGVETYGLYLLMHAAAGWVAALHFGAGAGLVRYAALYEAEGRRRALDDSLRHGAILIVGGAAAPALLTAGHRFAPPLGPRRNAR